MGQPILQKPIAAELGCVTPIIVVPGVWSNADLHYYAQEIVAGLVTNAGHVCLKPEIVITDAAWPQRAAFVDAIRHAPCSWERKPHGSVGMITDLTLCLI